MLRLRISPKTIPAAFLLTAVLAYGLMLPWTGFYWDDWPFAWIAHFLGPAEFLPAFAPFRPFLGPIFYGTTSLLPPVPIVWQSLAVLVRLAMGLSAWWTYKTVWPEAGWGTFTAGLLFLVFPGYSQHWAAYTHINQEWIPFLFYILSFGLTALAFRTPGKATRIKALALICMLPGVFPTEYFATQEPLRFLFLWALVSERAGGFRARVVRSMKLWTPYLLVWIANGAWLAYYYRYGAYASYQVSAVGSLENPPAMVLWSFLSAMAGALWKAGLYSWGRIMLLVPGSLGVPSTWLTIAVILLAFVLLAYYLRRLTPPEGTHQRDWAGQAMLFGALGILAGRMPSWAAGLPLTLGSIDDRFMVSMMLGGSLFFAGLLEWVFGNQRWKIYAVSLAVALGVGTQFYTANDFRRDWERQQQIFWQLSWRIPDLQPGTALLTHELPLRYETDMGLTAPLNWIYAPEYSGGELPYALLYTRTRLDREALPALEPGQPISFDYRTVAFKGSTSQAVTILVPPNACLRVLDPVYAGGDTYESQPRLLREAIPLSDPDLIRTEALPRSLPPALFGKEPTRSWCYYYEKAELARQNGNWAGIVDLGAQASARGLSPGDALEWLPFIEAYVRTGDLKTARELSLQAYRDDSRPRKGLCHTWKRIAENFEFDPGVKDLASDLLGEFDCAP